MPSLADLSEKALPVLEQFAGRMLAVAIRTSVWNSRVAAGKSVADCSAGDFIAAALPALRSYVKGNALANCQRELSLALEAGGEVIPAERFDARAAGAADERALTIVINGEADLVRVRRETRGLCSRLAYNPTDTVRCCTVVSELARNIVQYAFNGTIELREVSQPARGIGIVAMDSGPGIPNLEAILAGGYVSKTGMGRGLIGSRAILEQFEATTRVGEGTTVRGIFRAR
jgi:serine/threonine-protein kinase RsbT